MSSSYDFRSLSDYDFETLARDLLTEHLGMYFNSFKRGPDGGVDLRYASNVSGDTIVQCKHYARTPFAKLLKDLSDGKCQIDAISPNRYIIFTSLELSNDQKNRLVRELYPHLKSISDIFGFEDINYLLDKYPDVQKRNFKLWLSSISMLDIVIHRKMRNRTKVLFENILYESKRFVTTDAYYTSLKLLEEYKFCLISGAPGVGKTTLAKILILMYAIKNYELVYISQDIDEAFDVYEDNKKQIFYFDDFLGSTRLTQVSLHHDRRIIDFIDLVSRSNDSLLILTTRELILNQAIEYFDSFAYKIDRIFIAKQTVRIEDYTLYQKALILYNHIYYSKVNNGSVGKYISFAKYKGIIEHKNYNPRIIDIVLNGEVGANESNFPSIILENLDNPSRIWKPVLDNHITNSAKNLIAILFIFEILPLSDLRREYIALESSTYNLSQISDTSNDFEYVLKELDNSIIKISDDENEKSVSFINPSISDYLNIYYLDNPFNLIVAIRSVINIEILFKVASTYRKQVSSTGRLVNFSAFQAPVVLEAVVQSIKNQLEKPLFSSDKIILDRPSYSISIALSIIAKHDLYPQNLLDISKEYIEVLQLQDKDLLIKHPSGRENLIQSAKLSSHYPILKQHVIDQIIKNSDSSLEVGTAVSFKVAYDILGSPSEAHNAVTKVLRLAIEKFCNDMRYVDLDELDFDRIRELIDNYFDFVDDDKEIRYFLDLINDFQEEFSEVEDESLEDDEIFMTERMIYQEYDYIDYIELVEKDDQYIYDFIELFGNIS